MLRCSIAPTFLSKDRGRSVKESMQRCTVCYPGPVLMSLPRNTSQRFWGSPAFYGRDREGSCPKENKKAKTKWFRVERVQCPAERMLRDCGSSHWSVFCMQEFPNLLKLLSVFVLSSKFFCVYLREACAVCLFFGLLFGGRDSSSWKAWTSYFN